MWVIQVILRRATEVRFLCSLFSVRNYISMNTYKMRQQDISQVLANGQFKIWIKWKIKSTTEPTDQISGQYWCKEY